jgi:signal transduction histidine kinase
VNRNLITRMGTASGVVAALVAAVFAVLVTAVRDQRASTERARQSEEVSAAAVEVRRNITQLDLGIRGHIANAPDVRQARAQLPRLLVHLNDLVKDEPLQRNRVNALEGELGTYMRDPAAVAAPDLERAVEQLITTERATADARRSDADHKAKQAIALGIGGLVGSSLLIALLTTYLTRYIVVPLRRTVKAARRLTLGDLSARVVEEGDAEPVELARAFNQMAASLQESERLKDEFFALVSHELRTPLTSIIGYLELVLDDEEELSPEARRFLEVVDRNAKRLLRLVGDMLFVAQVEAGRLSLERDAVDLRAVAGEAVEAARPAAERSGVKLVLDADAVQSLSGDRDRFGQMLDNLVSNAVKFTPEGGTVTMRLRNEGDHALVEVADDGIGIPDIEQKRLFERFFRASTATSAAVPGAGLGLTIVKTIVEAHGGSIAITSREAEGTTVHVEMPYPRVPEQIEAA